MAPATCRLWGLRAPRRRYPEPFGGGKALGPEALAALADELGDFESGHTRFPAPGGEGMRGARRSTRTTREIRDTEYRGTSLINEPPPLGPHSMTMPRALWWS